MVLFSDLFYRRIGSKQFLLCVAEHNLKQGIAPHALCLNHCSYAELAMLHCIAGTIVNRGRGGLLHAAVHTL